MEFLHYSMYFINAFLFSIAVVVGLPKSSREPIELIISISMSSSVLQASASAASSSSKSSTLVVTGYPQAAAI